MLRIRYGSLFSIPKPKYMSNKFLNIFHKHTQTRTHTLSLSLTRSHLVIRDTQLSILASSVRLKTVPLPHICFIRFLYLGCCLCVFSTAFDHCPHMANIKMSMSTGNVFNPKEFDCSLYLYIYIYIHIRNSALRFWCVHMQRVERTHNTVRIIYQPMDSNGILCKCQNLINNGFSNGNMSSPSAILSLSLSLCMQVVVCTFMMLATDYKWTEECPLYFRLIPKQMVDFNRYTPIGMSGRVGKRKRLPKVLGQCQTKAIFNYL